MPWDDGIDWYPTPVDEYDFLTEIQDSAPQEFDYSAFNEEKGPVWGNSYGFGGGSSGSGFDFGGSLNSLLKALGLGGGSGLSNLLALLGAGYGAYNLNKATSGASEKLQAAADKSGAKATELLTGAQANFSPYITAGHNALAQLEALGARPLADKFTSTGAKLDSLGSFDKYLTLAKLAKTKGK